MFPKRSNIRFMHKVDVYEKTTTENDVGQLVADWSAISIEQFCYFTPSGAATSIRVIPTAEEAEYQTILFPHDAPVDYGTRLYNLVDRVSGESINPGPLQIVQINRHVSSISGKVQYLACKAKSVIE